MTNTFTVGFSDHAHLNELDWRARSRRYKTDHHEISTIERTGTLSRRAPLDAPCSAWWPGSERSLRYDGLMPGLRASLLGITAVGTASWFLHLRLFSNAAWLHPEMLGSSYYLWIHPETDTLWEQLGRMVQQSRPDQALFHGEAQPDFTNPVRANHRPVLQRVPPLQDHRAKPDRSRLRHPGLDIGRPLRAS
jgi:hypothetical protein